MGISFETGIIEDLYVWRVERQAMEAFPHWIYVKHKPSEIGVLHPSWIYVSLNGQRQARPWQVHLSASREWQGQVTSYPQIPLVKRERITSKSNLLAGTNQLPYAAHRDNSQRVYIKKNRECVGVRRPPCYKELICDCISLICTGRGGDK